MSRIQKLLVGAVFGLVVVIGGLAWWLGYFSDTPDEVDINVAAEAAAGTSTTADNANPTTTDPPAPIDNIDGAWTVQPNEAATFVGYRINEVLNTIGEFEVVGRTGDVTGTLSATGTSITNVELVAQMGTLTTDNGGRDRQMRSQALETELFPEATFILTSPIDIGAIPADGETISVVALGDLTIHGVTNAVEFPLDAQLANGAIVVVGQLPMRLADYDIAAPEAQIVASVADEAILELSVVFGR